MNRQLSLPDMIENSLGTIAEGWSVSPLGDPAGFQVVRCVDVESPYQIIATIGLSDHDLESRLSRRPLHIELAARILYVGCTEKLAAMLWDVASQIIFDHRPPLRGDVIKFKNITGQKWIGIYFTVPLFLPETLRDFPSCKGKVAIAWAVPIYDSEAQLIMDNGWEYWEDILDKRYNEIFDSNRHPFV